MSLILRPVSLLQRRLARLCPASGRCFALAPDLKERLDQLVQRDKVVVFMKGVPESPRCGFSNAVVQVLRMHAAPFQAYDVLVDEQLRQGVKEYSNWPTIPQVYVNGHFVGGCDILLQMHRAGDLVAALREAGITSALSDAEAR